MKLSDFTGVIATIAPTIATALGGPLAGTAVAALSRAVLGKAGGTEDEITKVLATHNPDTLLKIKVAEQEFKVKMKELEIEVDKLDAGDRDSARKMKTETGGNTQDILAGLFVGGYFYLLYSLMTGGVIITQENQAIIYTLVGIMSASVTQIMNFYFGSSKGSKDKTQALADALK